MGNSDKNVFTHCFFCKCVCKIDYLILVLEVNNYTTYTSITFA